MPVTIGGSGPITGVTSINTTVSDTELGYLDGVSSALQTQINAKAADSSQGLYLITPTSIANSSGTATLSGGLVNFSGVTSLSVNGCFTSTYQNYMVLLVYSSSTANIPYWRERLSGSDAATGYAYVANGRDVGGAAASFSSASATQAIVGQGATSAYSYLDVQVMGPALTRATTMLGTIWSVSSGNLYVATLGATHSVNTAYDGFTLYPDTGNFTGEMRIYGFKN